MTSRTSYVPVYNFEHELLDISPDAYRGDLEDWERDIFGYGIGIKVPATVLIVDDDPDQLTLFTELIHKRGYRVFGAVGPGEALDVLKSKRIDVLVCDIRMPDMSGLEFVRYLRISDKFRELPVIMITASVEDEQAELDSVHMGADMFCQKSLAPKLLGEQIDFFCSTTD